MIQELDRAGHVVGYVLCRKNIVQRPGPDPPHLPQESPVQAPAQRVGYDSWWGPRLPGVQVLVTWLFPDWADKHPDEERDIDD